MYIYKIHEKLVRNCGIQPSSDRVSRGGLKFNVPLTKELVIGSIMDQTFQVTGPKLWNVLPAFIRNIMGENLAHFKSELDVYLSNLEDIPRMASSKLRHNSLIDILGF